MAAKKEGKKGHYSPTLDKLASQGKEKDRTIDWDGQDPVEVYRLVKAVNRAGGSVLFGATRDRGAWCVTIWHPELGSKGRPEYCNTREMLPDFITDLANMWEAIAEELTSEE